MFLPTNMSDEERQARIAEDKLQTVRSRLGLDGKTDLVEEIERLQRLANGVEGDVADDDDESPYVDTDNANGGSGGTDVDESDIYDPQY